MDFKNFSRNSYIKNIYKWILSYKFILISIFLIGSFFRFYNLNWDNGRNFHPDEYNMLLSIEKISIPDGLDPQFYAYNAFTLYLDKTLITASDLLFPYNSQNPDNYAVVFRSVSALVSSISIVLIYYLGKQLKNRRVGLISAFIFAFTPTLIQHAHYYVTESMLIFLFLWLSLATVRLLHKNNFRNWIFLGVPMGLSVGTKLSALAYIVIPFTSFLILVVKNKKFKGKYNTVMNFIFFMISSFCIFFVVSPYTLLNSTKFIDSAFGYENPVVQGIIKVPYTLQFEHTTPFVFQFNNLLWQMGIFIPILGAAGMLLWIFLIVNKKASLNALPFHLYAIFYFLYICGWYAKFVRYTLPSIPIIILGASFALYYISKIKLNIKKIHFNIGGFILCIVLLSTFLWSLMNMSIFFNKSTRIAASEWIYENIPQTSVISNESYDYLLPSNLDSYSKGYVHKSLNVFDVDSGSKMQDIAKQLYLADYLVIASRRTYPNILNNKDQYPKTANYYNELFAGHLGFKQIKEFTSYPSLGPIQINDDGAEETTQVFDHPKILIFQNIGKLSEDQIINIIG